MRDGGRPVGVLLDVVCVALAAMMPAIEASASPHVVSYLAPAPAASAEGPYAEPALAVSPERSNVLVGGAIALEGGPHVVALRSSDAGSTWSERPMRVPGFEFGYDPSAAFYSPRGVAFAEVAVPSGSSCGSVASVQGGSVAVFSSSDSGASWSRPAIVRDDRGTPVFEDKPMIAADPSNGNVYLAWSQASTATGASSCQAIPSSNQLLVAVSHDGGRSFGSPVEISAPGYPTAFAAAMTVAADGKLFVAFEASRRDTFPIQAAVYVAFSSDGGRTFSGPRKIGPASEPAVPQGANLYPTSWPAITASPDGGVTVAWASGVSHTRIMWSEKPASTRGFSPPRALDAPPGDDLMPALAPGPVIGFLAFADSLVTPMVSAGRPGGFARPVLAGRPGQAASPAELGEYLGIATVLGRVSMLWPQVRDGGQVAMFARTHLIAPATPVPTPNTGSPTVSSSSTTSQPTPSATRVTVGSGGGGNWLVVIGSVLVVGLLIAGVIRFGTGRNGRHKAA